MRTKRAPGPGKGPTNLSGARGASPVLRVRMPAELLEAAEAKAAEVGEPLPDVVRGLVARWVRRSET